MPKTLFADEPEPSRAPDADGELPEQLEPADEYDTARDEDGEDDGGGDGDEEPADEPEE